MPRKKLKSDIGFDALQNEYCLTHTVEEYTDGSFDVEARITIQLKDGRTLDKVFDLDFDKTDVEEV